VPNIEVQAPEDLQAYRAYVERVATEENPETVIRNRSIKHASVIVEFIFRRARQHVEILTGTLRDDVYGTPEAIGAAIDFLRRSPTARIDILSEAPIGALDRFLVAVAAAGFGDRVHRWIVPADVQLTYQHHIVVADSRCFRFEPARTAFEAFVQFGNEERGAFFHNIFASLQARSELVHQ